MTIDFFEGAAGTGKTHNMVHRARDVVNDHILGDQSRVLALTFMNGARRRLQGRLAEHTEFRRRFECQTLDVFARTLQARRRALLRDNTGLLEQASHLNEFDAPCFLAGSLLADINVSRWVAASYPLVLVDEAQDLNEHRFAILKGLSNACHIVAAADAFQCLDDGHDTGPVMKWLDSAGHTTRLTRPQRTSQPGLLRAARALRDGTNILAELTKASSQRSIWSSSGIRVLECPARNSGLVARTIAEELSRYNGAVAILTPDARNPLIRDAIGAVVTRTWSWRNGNTFGPYACEWEMQDDARGQALLAELVLPDQFDFEAAMAALRPHSHDSVVAHVIQRINHARRTRDQRIFSRGAIAELVHNSVRNQSRLGHRRLAHRSVMTIQRAKNREFPNVVVLWPHTATGSAEHLRRLLYNAITRATTCCSVIVLGQGRLNRAPFAGLPSV